MFLRAKFEDLDTKSKIKNILDLYRGISNSKTVYQPRTNIVKDKTGDLVTGSYSILARRKDYFWQLLDVHGIHVVSQREKHTAEPLVPEPSTFEFDLAIGNLKNHKSPSTDQISGE